MGLPSPVACMRRCWCASKRRPSSRQSWLKEEDYMRLLKQALEPKDRLVLRAGCQHPWPCYGKPAIVFHDRGKLFTAERARQVLVDRLQIIPEQAPPYAHSAKGTVESLFRWMTQRFERRLPNTSY